MVAGYKINLENSISLTRNNQLENIIKSILFTVAAVSTKYLEHSRLPLGTLQTLIEYIAEDLNKWRPSVLLHGMTILQRYQIYPGFENPSTL